MRFLRLIIAATGLAASTAFASPTAPVEGKEFVRLAQPQPVQASGQKVEVLEFFMFHCPHCFAVEPVVQQWSKKHAAAIQFRRVHMPFTGPADPEAHLHLTLEAMGKAEEYVPKVFRAMHVERKTLNATRRNPDSAVMDWVKTSGLDMNQFKAVWNSFGVTTKLKRAPGMMEAYKVTSVPTFIIDGRYMTSPSLVATANPGLGEAQSMAAFQQVLDSLLARVQKEKGIGQAAAAPAAAAKKAGK